MFVRNGQALGSVQADPSVADPHKRKTAPKAKVEETKTDDAPPPAAEPEAPAAESQPETPAEPETPADEEPTEPAAETPEPAKKAPAKKAGFKSALSKG